VLEQSRLVGAHAMGYAGRPLCFLAPNSQFDSGDRGQQGSRNVIPYGTAWSAIFAIVCGAVGIALIAMYI
jgi:hypothetical protein